MQGTGEALQYDNKHYELSLTYFTKIKSLKNATSQVRKITPKNYKLIILTISR